VIVALTPAVMRLAHAARAIHEHHRALETRKAQVPGSSAGAKKFRTVTRFLQKAAP